MTSRALPQVAKLRGAILLEDHLRGRRALRTDYSEFEVPTFQRRWVERARSSRRKA